MSLPRNAPWLGMAAALLVGWWYHEHTIIPLSEDQMDLQKELAGLSARVAKARATIKSAQDVEQEAMSARTSLERIEQTLPGEPPLKWVPDKVTQHFQHFGFAEPLVRLISSHPEPEKPGYERFYWSVGLPLPDAQPKFAKALFAAAELEKAEPMLRVTDLATVPDLDHPGEQIVALTVSALLRQ